MNLPDQLRNLSPSEIQRMMHDGTILLIDVREPQEYAAQRIEGAVLVPLSSFDPTKLPAAEGREIVFQCGSGKRSAMAVAKCLQGGVPYTAHMVGGIQAWCATGLPTVG